jgi:hypothetical protein
MNGREIGSRSHPFRVISIRYENPVHYHSSGQHSTWANSRLVGHLLLVLNSLVSWLSGVHRNSGVMCTWNWTGDELTKGLYPTLGLRADDFTRGWAKTGILLASNDFHSLAVHDDANLRMAWGAPKQLGSGFLPSSNPGLVLISAKRTWADPTRSAHGPLLESLSHSCRKYCRLCRFFRLVSTVPSIICPRTHSMAWKRSLVRILARNVLRKTGEQTREQ